MNKLLPIAVLALLSSTALAAENCEEIKAQIDAKIKSVGVPLYKLEVMDADATTSAKVVGTCDGGKKKIVYWRVNK